MTQIKNPPWFALIFLFFSFQLLSIILSCGSRPSFVFSRQDFPPLRWNRFSTYVKKNYFYLPKLLMLWKPLSWFLHQILFFISIVVYLPALALEQVTQYQFLRRGRSRIWNCNLKHIFRHICLSLWANVCQKSGRGQLGPILCICICFCLHVCICIMI